MKKVMKVLAPVIRGFVLCAVALQIILGVVYIGENFMAVPQFRDTTIYLEMAKHFVADEYTGILYPLLVKLCYSISFLPYQVPIYVLQIAAGLYCIYYFVNTWTERKGLSLACALWINTIPFVAQAHVTVLPHSLAMSCMVLMFLQVLKGSVFGRPLRIMEWAELLCSYTILAQLTRGYIWVGTLFVIWAACLQLYMPAKKFLWFLISMLVCTGMLVSNLAIYNATEHAGYYGKIQNSLSSVFFQRTGVITLTGKYMIYMPEEIAECFTDAELNDFNRYPYKIETEFGPVLEETYGREHAGKLYRKLGILGLTTATKDNVIAMGKDAVSYLLPLAGYDSWQDGELEGATSWNYQQFLGEAPAHASAYAKICHLLWSLGFWTSLAVFVALAVYHRNFRLRTWLPAVICLLCFAGILTLNGTGAYDYKMALFPMILSYAPIGILVIKGNL